MFIWDTSLCSVFQFHNNFPDLLRFPSLVFPNDHWNFTAFFFGNSQVLLNIEPLLKVERFCLASNKLKSILHAVFTLVIYPILFVASFLCTNSPTLTGKNTHCTTFTLCDSSESGYNLSMEAASCHRLSPIHSNKN